jgi:GTPase SAR1 family protein
MSIDYKIILIGNPNVGKTSILRKLNTGEFNEGSISTIGIDKKTI